MRKATYILGLVALVLISCQENVPTNPTDDCPTYPDVWTGLPPSNFTSRTYDFRAPCFNPNNPNEFAYIRYPPGAIYNYELRKHNIQTGVDNLILNVNYCGGGMSWSQTDWIIFNQTLYDIWKVKSDGTGLIQLTTPGINMGAEWKPDGTAFIYYKDNLNLIADADGNTLDTLNIISASWSENNKLLYRINPTMAFYDMNSQSSTILTSIPVYQSYEWLPDGINFVGGNNGSLWLANTETAEKKFIKGPCGDKYKYFYFSVCPNGEKLLVERCEALMIDSFHYKINNDIVLMNLDGSNETVIELPQ